MSSFNTIFPDKLEIYSITMLETELERGSDFTLSQTGGDGRWSEYQYTIRKELFDDDAWYSVATYSEDGAAKLLKKK